MVADFKPTLYIFMFVNCFYNRAYPLLFYIDKMLFYFGLIDNVLEKPAIFLCDRYVAS